MPTDVASIFTALTNFGAFGILVGFLIWKDLRAEAARNKADEANRAEQRLADERRLNYDRERLEADKALSAALAALTAAVQSRNRE